MTERKPHKYADAIKAWADGKTVQYKYLDWNDREWEDNEMTLPRFDIGDLEWRVKPENIVIEGEITPNHHFNGGYFCVSSTENNIRLEFDPDTYKLVKAEVIE